MAVELIGHIIIMDIDKVAGLTEGLACPCQARLSIHDDGVRIDDILL